MNNYYLKQEKLETTKILTEINSDTYSKTFSDDEGDDDDDDDDDDDVEFFLWNTSPTNGVKPFFQPEPLSEALTIGNLNTARAEFKPAALNLSSGFDK